MGKVQSSLLLLPFLSLGIVLPHDLTQPAGLALLHRGIGSMSFYGNAAGIAVVQLSKKPHYFAHLGVINLQYALDTGHPTAGLQLVAVLPVAPLPLLPVPAGAPTAWAQPSANQISPRGAAKERGRFVKTTFVIFESTFTD